MANKNTNPGGGKTADSGVMHSPLSSRAQTRTRARGQGVVHNSGIGGFAASRIRVFVGHMWLLFWVFVELPQPPGHGKVK